MTSRNGKKIIIAFDLYGTLLSTESIAHELAKHYGEKDAAALAALWRRYQLEYTWRINSMGGYKAFNEITRSALGHALKELTGISMTAQIAEGLMKSYDSLHVFPEIPKALELLRDHLTASGADNLEIEAYIFSNGTKDMVRNSVRTSPELGPHAGLFRRLVTVDGIQCFKPDPRTYRHLVQEAGLEASSLEESGAKVWVVSANPFDVVGAKAVGLRAAFIDRSGKGWIDRLDEMRVPSVIARGVDEAIKAILGFP